MYFWDVKALAAELREDTVTEHERMKYYLLYAVGMAVIIEISSYLHTNATVGNLAASAIALIGTVIGIYVSYSVNRAGDNQDFIERSVCLGFPIAIQTLLIGVVLAVVGVLILGESEEAETTGILILEPICLFYYYWQLCRYLRLISDRANAPPPLPS